MTVRIGLMPRDEFVWHEVAEWSIREWGAQFPGDTVATYTDLYAQSCASIDALPKVYVAHSDSGVVGTVTLVDDDELPDAPEPGPWLAALYVRDDQRGRGIGRELVTHCESEARRLKVPQLWLYTPAHRQWYEMLGWTYVRVAELNGDRVDVMTKRLTSPESAPAKHA